MMDPSEDRRLRELYTLKDETKKTATKIIRNIVLVTALALLGGYGLSFLTGHVLKDITVGFLVSICHTLFVSEKLSEALTFHNIYKREIEVMEANGYSLDKSHEVKLAKTKKEDKTASRERIFTEIETKNSYRFDEMLSSLRERDMQLDEELDLETDNRGKRKR